MTMFRVDNTGDLVRSNGQLERVDGAEEIAQHVSIRFKLFQGEIPWNLALGMRYRNYILGKDVPPERIESSFTETALGTPGVVSVDAMEYSLNRVTRRGSIEWQGAGSLPDARKRIPLHDTFTVSVEF